MLRLARPSRPLLNFALHMAVAGSVLVGGSAKAQVVFSGSGATAAAITPIVVSFQSALGTINGNLPGSVGSGRREINWDAVPDAFSSPNPFPSDFFNANIAGR